MKTVIIADDHSLTLLGIKEFVTSLGYRVADTCYNGITALNQILVLMPEIAILDIDMPGMSGMEVAEKIISQKLNTKIILLTMHKESSIFKKALAIGVKGYILKDQALIELEKCLSEVSSGSSYYSEQIKNELINDFDGNVNYWENLTIAELKILKLISQKKTTKQIAGMLFISEKTIEGHRRNIIQKLDLPKEKNVLLIWAMENKDKLAEY